LAPSPHARCRARSPGALALAFAALLLLAPHAARALETAPANARGGGDGDDSREREGGRGTEDLLAGMTAFFHSHEVAGVTPDSRSVINPTEAARLGVASQLLGFNQMARLHPSRVLRQDVIDRANFLVDHFDELTSGTAFDGMTGYALLGAYEITRDPRYLEKGKRVVDQSLALSGWTNTLNWGLMSALALSKYYDLTGDRQARDKTLEIVASLKPYQNLDGSFPHYCPGSVDIHYTDWMSMELLIVRRWVPSPMIDQYLVGTRRFLENCIDSTGATQYQVPCPSCPGGWRYRFGRASGCYIDYDTRGWVNELGYSAILFGELESPRYGAVMQTLRGMESGGAFADKWDFFPPTFDPIYPWATANPSVIRTSVIFWSLAELEADRHAAQLADRGDDDDSDHHQGGDSGDGGDGEDDRDTAIRNAGGQDALVGGPASQASPHAAPGEVYSADSLMLAVVMGHELGAPSLAAWSSSGDQDPLHQPTRRGGAPGASASALSISAMSAPTADGAAIAGARTPVRVLETRIDRVSPNPSRHGCEIAFSLAREGEVALEIFDVTGRRVRVITRGPASAGAHQARWDGRDMGGTRAGPGLYFATLTIPGARLVARFVISP
jgi:hypothetical protein